MKRFHMLSQRGILKEHLSAGHSISRVTAMAQFGILNLPARISELRKEGFKIETEMRVCEGNTYAKYFHKKD